MRPLQARLITLCQQVLALGVVLTVLTPASGVVSLDIVGERPGGTALDPSGGLAAPARLMSATVPAGRGGAHRDRGAADRDRRRHPRAVGTYGRRLPPTRA